MKLNSFLALFLAVGHVNACIRIHARHFQAPWPEKDSLSIELYDNDNTYYRCPSCIWESYSDQNCKVQCHQYTIELGNYGKGGRVTNNNNGYTHSLSVQKAEMGTNWCCLYGNNGACRGQCQVWDNCNWDSFSNCNKYRCGLCGGKELCGPDKKKREFLVSDENGMNATQLEFGEVFGYEADW
jgi:hypothetical protein